MAQNDLTLFQETLIPIGSVPAASAQIDFENDEFKISLVKAATTPTAADAVPAYSGGTTNFNGAAECTPGGNYVAGGVVIANPSWVEVGGTVTFDAEDPAVWAINAANPTDAKWAIIYDNTTTIKYAIAFIDLGVTFDMTTGPLTVQLAATGILRISTSASV